MEIIVEAADKILNNVQQDHLDHFRIFFHDNFM